MYLMYLMYLNREYFKNLNKFNGFLQKKNCYFFKLFFLNVKKISCGIEGLLNKLSQLFIIKSHSTFPFANILHNNFLMFTTLRTLNFTSLSSFLFFFAFFAIFSFFSVHQKSFAYNET
jgi:hypothetical protein